MVTVADIVASWLEVAAESVSSAELAGLESVARSEIYPWVGCWPLPVSPLDLEVHWAARREEGISRFRLLAGRLILARALHLALLWRLVDDNPADPLGC
jgi:hypothetical protein